MITPEKRAYMREIADAMARIDPVLAADLTEALDAIDTLEAEVGRIAALKLTPDQTLTPEELAVLIDFHRQVQEEKAR
jgi:hypothetical protein